MDTARKIKATTKVALKVNFSRPRLLKDAADDLPNPVPLA